jgi:hypothetical protein
MNREQIQGAKRAARDVCLVMLALFFTLMLEWFVFGGQ